MPKKRLNRISRNGDLNAFSKGVLVNLKIRCWGASSKLDDSLLNREVLPKKIVRAVCDLLEDKAHLHNLNDVRNSAKAYLYRNSIPFPVDGLVFVLKQDILRVDADLKRKQEQFYDELDMLIATYPKMVSDYAEKYPHLYEPVRHKYPTTEQLRARFEFSWSFRHFTVPDAEMSVLPPELYEEEARKLQNDMKEMRDNLISEVGQQFLKKIDILKEQCFDGKISTNTVTSLNTFLDRFDNLWDGFIGHAQLRKMIDEVKLYMDGTEADMLRHDDEFRALVGSKMKSVGEAFGKLADARLHRKIDI